MTEGSHHFMNFYDQFVTIYPEFNEADVYLAGESWAGIYIPQYAKSIVERNQQNKVKINLKGIAIGNPWMSPVHQYPALVTFAQAKGLLSGDFLKTAQERVQHCQMEIKANPMLHRYTTCDSIDSTVLEQSQMDGKECLNVYDIRLTDKKCGMDWPRGLNEMYTFLSDASVMKAVHAQDSTKKPWIECDREVKYMFDRYPVQSTAHLIPMLVEHMSVYIFAGDQDFLCNEYGLRDMLDAMTWKGKTGFSVLVLM